MALIPGRFGARLMSIFARHGMTSVLELEDGTRIDVGFEEGGTIELDGAVQIIERHVEYLTEAVTLKRGMKVRVDGRAYTVKRPPDPQDDGAYSVAYLEIEK